jgi:hypothetical protein
LEKQLIQWKFSQVLQEKIDDDDDDDDEEEEEEEEEEALKWAALEKLLPTYDRLGKGILINISW